MQTFKSHISSKLSYLNYKFFVTLPKLKLITISVYRKNKIKHPLKLSSIKTYQTNNIESSTTILYNWIINYA